MTINGNFSYQNCLRNAVEILSQNELILTPRLDAEILLSFLLDCNRIDLILNQNELLSKDVYIDFISLVKRRLQNEPISYITNEKEFMSLPFCIEKGILIPRPETELLVEFLIQKFNDTENASILDLCTGSGAIAVSLAHYLKHVKMTAVDKYDVCINVTRKNAVKHKVNDRVNVLKADVLEKIPILESFDAIVSNPPYVTKKDLSTLAPNVKEYEPLYALDGGKDGLIFYRCITEYAIKHLKTDGFLVYEIGYDQGESVKKIIEDTKSFHTIQVTKDLAGCDRMVTAVKGEI